MTAPFPLEPRVLVVSADPVVRGGLTSLLVDEGLHPVAEVLPLADSLGAAPEHDVRAWDVGVGSYGLDRLRELATAGTPVVALVSSEEGAAEALAAGARGVVPRKAGGATLAAALRASAQGLLVVDEALAASLVAGRQPAPESALSPREHEVLQLLAEGHSNKIIADRLKISDHTAKFHVNSIFAKLHATTRTEAVVRAVRKGWLAL